MLSVMKALGLDFELFLFYLQHPQTIGGFCIHSGILNIWEKYMLFASNAKRFQSEVGIHIFGKKTQKDNGKELGKRIL